MEQKKLKINLVDIAAILVIILGVAFVGWKLAHRGTTTAAPEKIHVTYVARAEGVAAELYENAKEHLPSRMMASGALVKGNVLSVEKQPYYVLSDNGEWVEDPAHCTLYFTAEVEVDKGTPLLTRVGEQEIRVGKEHILKCEQVEFAKTIIVDVQWDG